MLRQVPRKVSRKQLAELLFDEFYDISCKRQTLKKSSGDDDDILSVSNSFQGEVVVTDSKKRLSGSFTRPCKKLQSRAPAKDDDQFLALSSNSSHALRAEAFSGHINYGEVAGAASLAAPATSNPAELPSELMIHETAVNIARMGDELDAEYKKKLEEASDNVADSVNQTGSSLTYEGFSSLLSSLIPQDRSAGAYFFVMHLSVKLVWKTGLYIIPMMRRYISEEFADEAEAALQQQQQQQHAN